MTSFTSYKIRCPECGVTQRHELTDGNQSVTCQRGKTDTNGGGQAGCGAAFRVSVLDGKVRSG